MPDTVPPAAGLPLSRETLASLAERILALARARGATDAEVEVSGAVGQSVSVRHGEVETVEYTRDKGASVTVYFGRRRGNASTSDLGEDSLARTVDAACAIARHTADDEAAGLPDADRLWRGAPPDLDLWHPWGLTVEAAIELARETEAAALAVDKRITNSEGATVTANDADFVLANTRGFLAGFPTSRASLGVSVVAEEAGAMQRDYWYSSERNPAKLEAAADVGRIAGERTVRRLGARRVPTGEIPVLFDANISGSLLGSFVNAASGSNLYRRSSFLLDKLGEAVFSPQVTILEDPHRPGEWSSMWFDAEGVATSRRTVVERGVLKGWFLSSYSARKLGLATTGNAGGNHNLLLEPGEHDQAGLLGLMARGLLVTDLIGQGVNPVTGDYSRGVAGYWVEGGEVRHPVEEVTIAGNLVDMFKGIVACGRDVLVRGSRQCGSILVERMTLAGE
jgi:PmbA protein